MPHSNVLILIDLVVVFVFSYILWRWLITSKSGHPPLPPGPRKLPLVGNAFQAPSSKEWETYTKWGQEYGDIVSISVFGTTIVILNSLDIALDMLDAKGVNYSDRQSTPMINLSGWGNILTFTSTGKYFRQQRALIHKLLGTPSALSRFSSLIEDGSRGFLRRILDTPENLADHVRHNAGAIILRITYGYKVQEYDDPFVDLAERSLRDVTLAASPATWIVDYLPFMKNLPSWCPGTRFREIVKVWQTNVKNMTDVPYEFVKQQMEAGTATPSFTSAAIEDSNLTEEEVDLIKWTSMVLYAGGSDTTVSAIRAFFLAMALYPDVLKKAQAEIDAVVGYQRLPVLSDRVNLPYVNALTHEVLRWGPVTPFAIGHKSSRDDIHAGYFIPAGSIVVPNVYFMLRDPRAYKNPECFNPERFLGNAPERDPRQMAFGFGRRICPGRLFAEDTMFVAIATSISVFDIKKKVKNGVTIEPVHRMTPGFISHPEPYEIDVVPRTDQARSLICEGI